MSVATAVLEVIGCRPSPAEIGLRDHAERKSATRATRCSVLQASNRRVRAHALSDGGLNYPTAMILGNVPPEGASQYDLPEGQMFIPYTLLLVRTKDNLVLNDVGAGDLGNPGDGIFPGLDHSTSRTNLLVPSLRAAGIDPGETSHRAHHACPSRPRGGIARRSGQPGLSQRPLLRGAEGVGLLAVG